MWDVGAIKGGIEFDMSQFTRGMREVNATAQLFPSWVSNYMASPLLGLMSIAKSAASSIASIFTSATEYADKASDLADALGMSVESLSALGRVAEYSGGNIDGVAQSMEFLSTSISKAVGGDKGTLDSFGRLGIDIEQLKASKPEEVFVSMADGMKSLASASDRTALARDLLGRGGGWAVGMMKDGSAAMLRQMEEVRQLGAVVSEDQAAKAAKWKDSLAKVHMAWEGFKQSLIGPMLDALTPKLEGIVEWFKDNPAQIQAIAMTVGSSIVGVIEAVWDALRIVLNNLREIAAIYATLKGGSMGYEIGKYFGMKGAVIGAVVGGVVGLGTELYTQNKIDNTFEAARGRFGEVRQSFNVNVNMGASEKSLRRLGDEFADKVGEAQNRQQARLSAEIVKGRI